MREYKLNTWGYDLLVRCFCDGVTYVFDEEDGKKILSYKKEPSEDKIIEDHYIYRQMELIKS